MGEVWEAVQVSLNRAVAVKRVVTHGKASDSTAARTRDFMMEALVSARLEHPNIVPVHDLGRDEAGRSPAGDEVGQGRILGNEDSRGV
jgi:serine/threonine protein kinase